jgi:hypothetical protein
VAVVVISWYVVMLRIYVRPGVRSQWNLVVITAAATDVRCCMLYA